jgi:hypothetical protein
MKCKAPDLLSTSVSFVSHFTATLELALVDLS